MDKIKTLSAIILFLLFHSDILSQNKNEFQIAQQYQRSGECEKAIILYQNFEKEKVPINSFYNNYLNCLIKLNKYSEAEKLIKKTKKIFPKNLTYKIDLGFIWKLKGFEKKAIKEYDKIIFNINKENINQTNSIATKFSFIEENEYALKTYQKAQKINPLRDYGYQIANMYRKIGQTEIMIEEFINLIKRDPSKRQTIQNTLQSSFSKISGDKKNFDILKFRLKKEIQKNNNIDCTEMLIWLLMQEENFKEAFIYSKALQKRLKEDNGRIFDLASISHENKDFETAKKCYNYIIDFQKSKYYIQSKILLVIVEFDIILEKNYTESELIKIKKLFTTTLDELGKNITTSYLLKEYANLIGLYFNNVENAIEILTECIEITENEKILQAECKLDLGDMHLINNDYWEAIILYSQVEKSFKENPIGHEAKFKRAKISYFQGEFDWAQAQLDVLKASTSKLIANNAMELSLFITDNLGLDTSNYIMKKYAEIELLILQNKLQKAEKLSDSLINILNSHSLEDDIFYMKGKIAFMGKNYKKAVEIFTYVAENYSFDILADDALYQAAKISEELLQDYKIAKQYYEKIILNHKGSIFTNEARKKYRLLEIKIL